METTNTPLYKMASTTPTQYWNDSCSHEELTYALARGATGATSNPSIVYNVLKAEIHRWEDHIRQTIANHPDWNETKVSWKVFTDITLHGAELLLDNFNAQGETFGRMSIQTDPANYMDTQAILDQTLYFAGLAPNMQIKLPATSAGINAVEEATYQGVNLNVTVSFTVPQVIAVAEAVERGLNRRDSESKSTDTMTPVATLMVGRLDDWCKIFVKQNGIEINPEHLEWCGVAAVKKAYKIFKERGYRTRLLPAAYRNFYHWTEFIGGDLSLTIPYDWQVKFNNSDAPIENRMDIPVDPTILDELYNKVSDFRRAYDEDGMTLTEFDHYGATVRTLRGFIKSWHDLVAVIRDYMLPNPDIG